MATTLRKVTRPRSTKGTKSTAERRGPDRRSGRRSTALSAAHQFRDGSKAAAILELLAGQDGASVTEIAEATGWQQHSVRGFLSGTLKKKLGLEITSTKGNDGHCRYRIMS